MQVTDMKSQLIWDGIQRGYKPAPKLTVDESIKFYTGNDVDVDPITFEVIRYGLLNINFEHADLIQRLCASPVSMLARDFQATILTETGDLAFLGPNLQYFSTCSSFVTKWTLENRGKVPSINEGDMFLCNDPYIGSPHQSDLVVIAPIFVEGKIFSWVANVMHHADVGGTAPGSFIVDATDCYNDPTCLPPLKIVASGVLQPDVEGLFLRLGRLPDIAQLDLRAAITGNNLAKERIISLIERYSSDVVKTVINRTIDSSEALFVDYLSSIPDGTWRHRSYTEVAVTGDENAYCYQINITKKGNRIIVDNEGTDPQVGAINISYGPFVGCVIAALTQTLIPELAGAYGGVYRCIDFKPTSGTLNCADYPAAVSPSGPLTTVMVMNTALVAVAKMVSCGNQEVSRKSLGPGQPHFYFNVFAGADEQGRPIVFTNLNAMLGAIGGMDGQDGIDSGGHFWAPDGIAQNVEDLEQQYPVLYLSRKYLDRDADGAGTFNGGRGFSETVIPWKIPAVAMVFYLNDSFPKTQGLWGGNPGSRAWFRAKADSDVTQQFARNDIPRMLDDINGTELEFSFKGAPQILDENTVWEMVVPTSGGWGDPLGRDPKYLEKEVIAKISTTDVAKSIYGVVIEDNAVNLPATQDLRIKKRMFRANGQIDDKKVVRLNETAQRVSEHLFCDNGRWVSSAGVDLGSFEEGYRNGTIMVETRLQDYCKQYEVPDNNTIASKMYFREYLCPASGVRIDAEIIRNGDPDMVDVELSV